MSHSTLWLCVNIGHPGGDCQLIFNAGFTDGQKIFTASEMHHCEIVDCATRPRVGRVNAG